MPVRSQLPAPNSELQLSPHPTSPHPPSPQVTGSSTHDGQQDAEHEESFDEKQD
jgi:hypothetical protein